MKELFLTKTLNGFLVPETDEDKEILKSFAVGETIKAKVSKPRNIQHHRKFFALLNITHENQTKHQNFEHFRKYVICCTGRYDEIPSKKGLLIIPHSISFASMNQIDFNKFYEEALEICSIILNVETETLDEQVRIATQKKIQDF